jgi:hypothetical protein
MFPLQKSLSRPSIRNPLRALRYALQALQALQAHWLCKCKAQGCAPASHTSETIAALIVFCTRHV